MYRVVGRNVVADLVQVDEIIEHNMAVLAKVLASFQDMEFL